MLDVKECRKIKRECTKNNEGKNIILSLDTFPFIYMIVTHGDGKSWGYFFEITRTEAGSASVHKTFLGRSDREIVSLMITYNGNGISCRSKRKILTDNKEVKRVYDQLLDFVIDRYCYSDYLKSILTMNPKLVTNIVDSGLCTNSNNRINFFMLNTVRSCNADITKPLIKDAFGLPMNWVKFVIERCISIKIAQKFKKYNYKPEDLGYTYVWHINNIPEDLIPNKKFVVKYLSDGYMRDYIHMRIDLPDNVKKDFPLCPEDSKKWHDKILPVYNRNKELIQMEKVAKCNEEYLDSVYKAASKFDFEDEEYSIFACKDIRDLIKEGNALHHCVGSYVNSVCAGREYILFLRKKTEIDTPYFTVDVTPSKDVRQIHGLRNCNMNDLVKPFVQKWAKKFGLNISNCSGIRAAIY